MHRTFAASASLCCAVLLLSCTPAPAPPRTFEECAALGNPVMESLPRRCRDAGGREFVEGGDALYEHPLFRVRLRYPSGWIPDPSMRIAGTEVPTGASGSGGRFRINAIDSGEQTLDQITDVIASFGMMSFGADPVIVHMTAGGQQARLLLPATGAAESTAALIVRYPEPIVMRGATSRYFLLEADDAHIRAIAETLEFLPDAGPSSTAGASIVVVSPQSGEEIGLPLVVTGRARVFENQLNFRLRDADSSLLLEGLAMAESAEAGMFGPFRIEASYPEPKGDRGTVEVFTYSPVDGTEIDAVTIPVVFDRDVRTATVQVYFGSSEEDPKTLYCDRAYPVSRRIPKTSTPAEAAIEQLLIGPLPGEARRGYFTSIPAWTRLGGVMIRDGLARVEFDENLERGVAGSCRVGAIRAQIEATLRQFPSVEEVVIAVGDRTEDVLQP